MADVDLVISTSKSATVNAPPPGPVIVNVHISLMVGKQSLTEVWCATNVARAFHSIQFVDMKTMIHHTFDAIIGMRTTMIVVDLFMVRLRIKTALLLPWHLSLLLSLDVPLFENISLAHSLGVSLSKNISIAHMVSMWAVSHCVSLIEKIWRKDCK